MYGIGESKRVQNDKLLENSSDLENIRTLIVQLKKDLEFPFRKSAILKTLIRCYFPYKVETCKIGDKIFGLFINREYQPLGSCCYGESYDEMRIAITRGFLCKEERDFYFYNDGNAPYLSKKHLREYLERVSKFISEIKQEQLEIRGSDANKS